SFSQAALLKGWSIPGRGRKCRSIQESPLPEGQPPRAAHSESSCQRRGQVERNHFPDCLSPTGIAPGTQSDHRGHCPSAVSPHLDHSPSWCELRRARSLGECKDKTTPH